MDHTIKTSFLIISDTHGDEKIAEKLLNLKEEVDVAIHCGDLTEGSEMSEFRSAFQLLKGIKAHLKLVIAGNHDWAMDNVTFDRKTREYVDRETKHGEFTQGDHDLLDKSFGTRGEARSLFESTEAKAAGIIFLDEGTHHLTLANGANLKVYTSPYTCSREADWGYQYTPSQEHEWDIPTGIDIAITHSPPRGVLDLIDKERRNGDSRAGSPSLFNAIAHSKPKMHCFGHIHESWGSKLVTWRDDVLEGQPLTHFNAIDNGAPKDENNNSSLRQISDEGEQYPPTFELKLTAQEVGRQTLFVNAALEELEKSRPQPAFIVEMPLSEAQPTTAPAAETVLPKPEAAQQESEAAQPKKRKRESNEQETPLPFKRACWC
ncbi:hypothetical protein M409DRAFT_59499 [Zasmidium cellare ATCC 36951]|uniref:Calcineurin-like phosphoesterase domain-containing protein n=1 Tax=Zasmidium cellare ATCC 36951 TaxID=1080233 RepID=A0A6A6C1Z1_ZASCE|nr:uncharacterized protein M409DRAFT_59499 [Zasmidium cellare ATCC 36951]KAF2160975.1 hypothetical protein M409DRAFT_59499 [Zasmidium cellare ATCC 36951]